MYKLSCKHQDIYQEMLKIAPDAEISLDESQESFIQMGECTLELYNASLEVLKSLGYIQPPVITDGKYKEQPAPCFVNDKYPV